jgi:hypothetical protein
MDREFYVFQSNSSESLMTGVRTASAWRRRASQRDRSQSGPPLTRPLIGYQEGRRDTKELACT